MATMTGSLSGGALSAPAAENAFPRARRGSRLRLARVVPGSRTKSSKLRNTPIDDGAASNHVCL